MIRPVPSASVADRLAQALRPKPDDRRHLHADLGECPVPRTDPRPLWLGERTPGIGFTWDRRGRQSWTGAATLSRRSEELAQLVLRRCFGRRWSGGVHRSPPGRTAGRSRPLVLVAAVSPLIGRQRPPSRLPGHPTRNTEKAPHGARRGLIMGEVIKLLKVSPADQAGNSMPFMIPVSSVIRVQIPDSEIAAPNGVFLIQLSDYPGLFWSWDLNPGDLPDGTPFQYERLPQ